VQTTPVGSDVQTTVNERTGMHIKLFSHFIVATLYKGHNDILISVSRSVGDIDMSVIVQSMVVTYRRADHMLSIFFNGIFLGEISAPASSVYNVIDWSKSDNLYVNQNRTWTPGNPTRHHKISVYDKILTPNEIVNIHNESQPLPPVIHFDLQTWEANQTAITRDGSLYETNLTEYPEYADGLTWGLRMNMLMD
jgi:hypothetical protein